MKILLWIIGALLLNVIAVFMFMFGIPFIFELWNKLKKGTREMIVFLLFYLWHYCIIRSLIASNASNFNIIASAIGIIVVDLYLFFNHYNKSNK